VFGAQGSQAPLSRSDRRGGRGDHADRGRVTRSCTSTTPSCAASCCVNPSLTAMPCSFGHARA